MNNKLYLMFVGLIIASFSACGGKASSDDNAVPTSTDSAVTTSTSQATSNQCNPIPGAIPFGINLISKGNQYANSEYSDANLDTLFSVLKSTGISKISIRVIWQIMEPTQGVYNAAAIANLNRIFAKADANNFDVMLDFHTLFNANDQFWQAPTWLQQLAPETTVNGETIPAGSLRHLFYNDSVRIAYANMMQHVVEQVGSHSSLNSIYIMNEPYLNWNLNWNSTSNNSYFDATISDLITRLRPVTDKPLGIRYLPGWNPWSDQRHKAIGSGTWKSLNFIAMNQYYPDPDSSSAVQDGTVFWPMVQRALDDTHGAGKRFIVSESGYGTGTNAEYAQRWQNLFANRFTTYRPDAVFLWNGQNDGSYFDMNTGGMNIFKAKSQFADYVLTAIIPTFCR